MGAILARLHVIYTAQFNGLQASVVGILQGTSRDRTRGGSHKEKGAGKKKQSMDRISKGALLVSLTYASLIEA